MPALFSIILIILSSIVLIQSVKYFIDSSSRIAFFYNLSGYTISFFLVAIATSLPELTVGITSAIEGNPSLSYGNALGSNIALLTLVIGIPSIMGIALKTRSIIKSQDIYYTAFFTLLALGLALDGKLSKLDGIILLTSYLVYLVAIIRRGHPLEGLFMKLVNINIWKQIVIFSTSLLLLLVSSEGIVTGAIRLSSNLGISIELVGLTLTAIGTSLPEIAYAISATRHRREDQILGDIIGSVVANSTLVLGATAIIAPIIIPNITINIVSAMAVLVSLILFLIFSKTRNEISKVEGFILISIYLVFLLAGYLAA